MLQVTNNFSKSQTMANSAGKKYLSLGRSKKYINELYELLRAEQEDWF